MGRRNVTREFSRRSGRILEGLVTGLRVGRNLFSARLADGTGARITITNHPIGGPLFSGPEIQPRVCLAGSLDRQCNAPATRVRSPSRNRRRGLR